MSTLEFSKHKNVSLASHIQKERKEHFKTEKLTKQKKDRFTRRRMRRD